MRNIEAQTTGQEGDEARLGADTEAFFARARTRLLDAPLERNAPPAGDFQLNPAFSELGDDDYRDAAVLMPVVAHAAGPTMLLTTRTPNLSAHAGQIAFPGGKIDPDDAGAAEAAVREANEEIGLTGDRIEVVGYLDTYLTRTGFRIVPVLARVAPGFALRINPDEVADAFEVPLAFLLDPANHRTGERTVSVGRATFHEIPYGDRYIWGVTAGIIRSLYKRMVG